MERSHSESSPLDCFREFRRCSAIAERAEFVERSCAVDVDADRFSSATRATGYAAGADTDHEQRFKLGSDLELE